MTTAEDEKRIAAEVAVGKKSSFTDDEMEALRSFAQFWLGMQAVGRAAGVLQRIVRWIGWLIALYIAVKAGAAEWVASVIAKTGGIK